MNNTRSPVSIAENGAPLMAHYPVVIDRHLRSRIVIVDRYRTSWSVRDPSDTWADYMSGERRLTQMGSSTSNENREVDDVLHVINYENARQILAFARRNPLSAEELADQCDASLPTIYRRINELLDYELLEERIQIDSDGNHYRVFETDVERISLLIEPGRFGVEVRFARDIVDKFGAFWRDLGTGTK